jgi:hypothetical protein
VLDEDWPDEGEVKEEKGEAPMKRRERAMIEGEDIFRL